MPLFKYRGRNHASELVSGELEAVSADAVASHLNRNRIIAIDIVPAPKHGTRIDFTKLFQKQRPRIQLDDMAFFCSQMYTLLRAGVPIMDALKGLQESTASDELASVVGQLAEDLDAGLELSTAMRRHPECFTTLFWGLVEMGEVSGNLPESFLQLGGYIERERDTRSKIKSAMRYPMIVVGAITAAMFIINMFVIPAFANVFARFHAELPLITRMLIAVSDFTVHYWYVLIGMVAGAAFAVRVYLQTPQGAFKWDRHKLRIPLIGKIFFYAALSRFAYTMAITVRAGVPWGQGMAVVGNAVDNRYLAEAVLKMRAGIESGATITHTASASGLFPPTVLQMLRVGELTGDLERLLTEVAAFYDREIDYRLKTLSSSIEPLLIVVIGVIVLLLALGVFMPMWGLGKAALGG